MNSWPKKTNTFCQTSCHFKFLTCNCLLLIQRLYRATYHKNKDKIHTTPDTPEIRQVKATQEAVSDVCVFLTEKQKGFGMFTIKHVKCYFYFVFQLIYKSDFFRMQGHLISLPYTPQVLHCRYVGDITSDVSNFC